MKCPCQSGIEFMECCEPYLNGAKLPPTAESLMRARYTAHVRSEIKFIRDTLTAAGRHNFNEKAVKDWAEHSEWLGLKILSTQKGQVEDTEGIVEFIATYKSDGKVLEHHEVSQFRKDPKKRVWQFVDGDSHIHENGEPCRNQMAAKPVIREVPKVGRNDPCTCGSGAKFKKCCGASL